MIYSADGKKLRRVLGFVGTLTEETEQGKPRESLISSQSVSQEWWPLEECEAGTKAPILEPVCIDCAAFDSKGLSRKRF